MPAASAEAAGTQNDEEMQMDHEGPAAEAAADLARTIHDTGHTTLRTYDAIQLTARRHRSAPMVAVNTMIRRDAAAAAAELHHHGSTAAAATIHSAAAAERHHHGSTAAATIRSAAAV